jgi:outer membrane scaffolding protein for murein synthesis (MipA/OmpV family)
MTTGRQRGAAAGITFAGLARALGGFALFGVPLLASAELSNDTLLGPGLRSRPAYDGSASQRVEIVPVVRYLGLPWFVRSTQGVLEGGLRTELTTELHGGVQLAYEPGRSRGEAGFLSLHQVPDIDRGVSLGAQLEWDHHFGRMPVTALTRWRQHVERDRGAQVDVRLSAGVLHLGALSGGVFTQATWATARSTDSMYGMSSQQAVLSSLPAYAAGSGWLAASVGLLGSVDLDPRWVIVGSLEARRLQGNAAGSPLVQQRSSHFASLGLAYRY